MNERGQSTFLSLILLMTIAIIGVSYISLRIDHLRDQKDQQSILLCSKDYNGALKKLTSLMESTNKMLKMVVMGEVFSILIPLPGLNLALKSGAKSTKALLKSYQYAAYLSYMKKVGEIILKGCARDLNLVKSPYRTSLAFKLSRDKFEQTILRTHKWRIKFKKGRFQITTLYQLTPFRLKSRMKEVNRYWNLLPF